MDLEYLSDEGGIRGNGIYLTLSEALAQLNHIAMEPAEPPFRDGSGKAIKVVGSSFVRLSIRGLKSTRLRSICRAPLVGPAGAPSRPQ